MPYYYVVLSCLVFECDVSYTLVGRLVSGPAGRQFLHRAADWARSLDVIQLADILGCVYWCLFVK